MTKVDKELVSKKLQELKDYLQKLEEFRNMDEKQFTSDYHNYALAEHTMQQALEIMLDICRKITIGLEAKIPDDSHGLLPLLNKSGVLSEDFVERNKKLPGFRNRLVHLYETIDHAKTYAYLQEHYEDFQEFIKQVSRFLLK